MDEVLNRNLLVVREHVGLLKAANNYDVHDPETDAVIMQCREEKLGWMTKILRFSPLKRRTPFDIQIRTPDGSPLLRVARGVAFFVSRVNVRNENDERIGGFRQKLFAPGGRFDLLDENDQPACSLKGKWHGWDFRFVKDGLELARVRKEWAGAGKELFTSADNYVLSISDAVPPNDPRRPLFLAAVMCIDMVLNE